MTNLDLSLFIFDFLKLANVKTIVVCAGARNAPLVLALKNQDFKVIHFFEERSAAFFALGLIKSENQPVAVITTSGTAVAELLPATIESFYQGLPLVLITADRPKNYRHTGAPQSIEQVGIFSNYVENGYDIDVHTEKLIFEWSFSKPLHLNISFDEPLIDFVSLTNHQVQLIRTENQMHTNNENSVQFTKPLVIIGQLADIDIAQVIDFILKTKAPVYAESISQILCENSIQKYLIKSSDQLVRQLFDMKLCNTVIRIGGVPTLRFWRDLEFNYKNIPVFNYSTLNFSGLSRKSSLYKLSDLKNAALYPDENLKKIELMDSLLLEKKLNLLRQFPESEQAFTQKLSDVIGSSAVYLGNSLSIRNWDQFANNQSKSIYASRGANGIDGQISTYLGWSESQKNSYCFIGDLTAMYDLASLALIAQLNSNQRNIVIMNNFGGQIFKRVFNNDEFINSHKTQFQHWAAMWGCNYIQIKNSEDFKLISTTLTQFNIIELIPDATETEQLSNQWSTLCQPN